MNIAIIPARGGSKRIPKKNIKPFFGKMMIEWSIQNAKLAGCFDHVIVSTDDREIAEISRMAGAETPFIRPKSLADDFTPTVPVIAHAISACTELGWKIDNACCIYPCAPFIKPLDLKKVFAQMSLANSMFAYPVTEYVHPTQRAMRRSNNGKMSFIYAENELKRTQDLEKTYHDVGQFYWGQAKAWLDNKKMHTDGIGVIVPSWRFVDIDNEEDWSRAEHIFKFMMKNE